MNNNGEKMKKQQCVADKFGSPVFSRSENGNVVTENEMFGKDIFDTVWDMSEKEQEKFYDKTVKIFDNNFPNSKFSNEEKKSVCKWFIDNHRQIENILKIKKPI